MSDDIDTVGGYVPAKRMFDSEALTKLVKKTLDESVTVPDEAKGAFLTVANSEGIKAVIAVRVHGDWTVQAVVEHAWKGGTNYGAAITGTF